MSTHDLADKLAGAFLVIDGPDGAGKSTQVKLLAAWLREQGVDVVETRDPGGTAIGDRIREILLDNVHAEMTVGCEIQLYMASRTQLMGEVIGPALQAGQCVLCDRWVSSTVAYQVAEGKATAEDVLELYRLALRDVWPDLTILLDLDADEGLRRAANESAHDRMESKGSEFHRKVREGFRDLHTCYPAPVAHVDASGTVEENQTQILAALREHVP